MPAALGTVGREWNEGTGRWTTAALPRPRPAAVSLCSSLWCAPFHTPNTHSQQHEQHSTAAFSHTCMPPPMQHSHFVSTPFSLAGDCPSSHNSVVLEAAARPHHACTRAYAPSAGVVRLPSAPRAIPQLRCRRESEPAPPSTQTMSRAESCSPLARAKAARLRSRKAARAKWAATPSPHSSATHSTSVEQETHKQPSTPLELCSQPASQSRSPTLILRAFTVRW